MPELRVIRAGLLFVPELHETGLAVEIMTALLLRAYVGILPLCRRARIARSRAPPPQQLFAHLCRG